MAGLIDKRKRSREEDVFCDSTPLSKRINNLHLSNNESSPSTSRHLEQRHHYHYSPQERQQQQQETNNGHPNHGHEAAQSHPNNGYNPELNEVENPFYFVKNRLLHELHLERLKRCAV